MDPRDPQDSGPAHDPDRTAEMVPGSLQPPGQLRSGQTPIAKSDVTLGPEIRSALEFPTVPGYALVRELGQGGFGRVYEAVTSDAVAMRVAIKVVLHPDPAALRSFENEKKILANLVHPNIARYQASGVLDDGRPWMAMEFVEGMRLDKYCDREQLSTAERLTLFRKVCDAVQHAHEFGIWHLDLKPQNILVTLEGEPKLLDFGIAKVSRAIDSAAGSAHTRGFFTYLYSSPEQLRGEPLSSRSDVYNLGLILYELLTGTRVRNPGLEKIDEFVRAALQTDPEPPSLRVSRHTEHVGGNLDLGLTGTTTAQGGAGRLSRGLRGDLDNIVLMALRREPTKRYDSPKALAEDIGRHLENLPVEARRASVGYRFARQLQRHRLQVAASLVASVGVLGGSIASTMLWREAVDQRAHAEQREQETLAVLRFQEAQLANVSQGDAGAALFGEIEDRHRAALGALGKGQSEIDASVAALRAALSIVNPTDVAFSLIRNEVLPRSGARVEQDFAEARGLQASLFMTLGRTAYTIGDFQAAQSYFTKANSIHKSALGDSAAATLDSRRWLLCTEDPGDPLTRLNQAEALFADTRRALGANALETLESQRLYAQALLDAGRGVESASEYEQIAQLSGSTAPLGHDSIRDLGSLGEIYRRIGKIEESERVLREAVSKIKATSAASPRLRAEVLNNLGLTLTAFPCESRDYEAGLALFREVWELDKATDGEAHSNSLLSGANLAARLGARPEHAGEASVTYAKLRSVSAGLRVKSDEVLLLTNDYASWIFSRIGKPDATGSEPTIDELRAQLGAVEAAYEVLRVRLGEDDDACRRVAASIAMKRMQLGDSTDAENRLKRVIEAKVETLGGKPGHFEVLDLKADLAMAQASQGRWRDAVETLAEAQADGARDGLPLVSDARWNVACRYRNFLMQWASSAGEPGLGARIAEQEKAVEALRRARVAAGRCSDRDDSTDAVRVLAEVDVGSSGAAGPATHE